jgi:hypothetical protein
MRITQIFFRNLMAILKSRGHSLTWIEDKTGISEVFLSTFEWIASGLSFHLVIKVAVALGVTIESLISEDGKTEAAAYEESDPKSAHLDIYRHFWAAVDYEADRKGKDLYDIAWAAGKSIAGIVGCATRDKDLDIQRAEAIAILLDTTIDRLIWEPIPEYPYYEENFINPLVANF